MTNRILSVPMKDKKIRVHFLLKAPFAFSHPIIINVSLVVNQLQSSTYPLLALSFRSLAFFLLSVALSSAERSGTRRSNSPQAIISALQ